MMFTILLRRVITGTMIISTTAFAANVVQDLPAVSEQLKNQKSLKKLDEKPVPLFASDELGSVGSVKPLEKEEKPVAPAEVTPKKKMAFSFNKAKKKNKETAQKTPSPQEATDAQNTTIDTLVPGNESLSSNEGNEDKEATSKNKKGVFQKTNLKMSKTKDTTKGLTGEDTHPQVQNKKGDRNNNESKNNKEPLNPSASKEHAQASPAAEEAPQDHATREPEFKVLEFVLAKHIVQREPQDVVETFEGTDKGFAFARLNVSANSEITFVWFRNNHVYTQYTTPIQAAKTWRTYSSIKLKPGDWKVQLLGKNKEVLAEKSFIIK